MCVCVLALERFWLSLTVFFVSVYLREFCGFKFTRVLSPFFLYMYTHVCVYECV